MSAPDFTPSDTELPSPATAWLPGDGVPIPGPPGPTGDPGPPNTLTIGTVTAGITPAATITGTSPNQVLNLQLPQGNPGSTGLPGAASSLSIGTVTEGSPAAATITGTPPNQQLNLTLPSGSPGPVGPAGANGSIIYSGNGIPPNSLGVQGDYYVDNQNKNWWGPKGTTTWPATPAFSMVPAANVPRRVIGLRSTNQAVGAWPVMLAFQSVNELNISGTWSAGQPTRIVVPAGVSFASVVCQVEVDGGATAGTLITETYKNGVQLVPRVYNNSGRNTTSGSAINILTDASYEIPVVAGDYLEIQVNQSALTSNNIIANSLWCQVRFS